MDKSFKAQLKLNSILKGQRVKCVREMSDREISDRGFRDRPLVIVFESGVEIFAASQDCGNGAKMMFDLG